MSGSLQDVRYALRHLRKNPGFTLTALVTIAVGIAANVSVFTFKDALFLRSVPAKDPSRLVRIRAPENDGAGLFSYPEYAYLRDHSKTVASLVAHYSAAPLYVTANGDTEEIIGAVVSSNYFATLGLRPYRGRFFTSEEDFVPDRDAVAVLGYDFWTRTYNRDPNVLAKALAINGETFSIIGVMPPQFRGVTIGGMPNEIWIPTATIRVGYRICDGFQPSCTVLDLMGRLAPGKSQSEAKAELTFLLRQLQKNASGFDERLGISVQPAIGIPDDGYFRVFVRLLSAIAALVLVIVCANLAGLLLARGKARDKELSVRQAMGASPTRIARQLLTESFVLAGFGGILGTLISVWTSRLLAGYYSVDDEGYRHVFDLRLDLPVLGYSVLVTVVAGLIFGLLPSWHTKGPDVDHRLKVGGGHGHSTFRRSRTALITAQVALALALVTGAGLMARSARHIKAGMNMDLARVLGLRLCPQLMNYPPAKAQAFTREVLQRLRNLPGVESVSLAKDRGLVWRPNETIRVRLPAQSYRKLEDEPVIEQKPIAPAYFATLGIPFVAGRDFVDSDTRDSIPVAIVNETLAHSLFKANLPLGRTMLLNDKPYEIVGIVKDAQTRSIAEGPQGVAYVSFWQDSSLVDSRVCVRVTGSPRAALPLIRKAIAVINPNVPVTETMPLAEQVRAMYTDVRVGGAVLGCAALIGLLLSAMGLFAVIAYEVSRRRHEIGIRVALGANSDDVVRLFLKQGSAAILAGIAIGVGLALLTSRLLAAWLFGVLPSDPATFARATATLLISTLLASYIPARRASKVDPMVALHYE